MSTPYAARMAEVRLSAEQASAVAAWSVEGAELVPLGIHDGPPSYACDWRNGDVLVLPGDSCVHIGPAGRVKDNVPSATDGLC
jgi:hypothetical protein